MTYRGLDPRTRLTRWGLVAVAGGIVIGVTGPAVLVGLGAVVNDRVASLPWLLERLAAFLAYLAMTGSIVYGLLLSTRILDAIAHRPVSFALHQDLAAVGLGLAGIHGALLGLDAKVTFTIPQMAVPGLAPHAPLAVAIGQLAWYVTAVVIASFYLRRVIGQRAWRALHALTFLAFVAATAHGILAGSDSGTQWAWWLYTVSVVVVTFLFVYRIRTGLRDVDRRSRPHVSLERSAPRRVDSP